MLEIMGKLHDLKAKEGQHREYEEEERQIEISINEDVNNNNQKKERHCKLQYEIFTYSIRIVMIFIMGIMVGMIIKTLTTPESTIAEPETLEPTTQTTTTSEPTTLEPTTWVSATPETTTWVSATPRSTTPKPTFPPLTKTRWVQVGNDIDGLSANDESGLSVSMSSLGDIVVVGAPRRNDYNVAGPGSAQVYRLNVSGNKWNMVDRLLSSGSSSSSTDEEYWFEENWFGSAVSTSDDGTVIAIGAPYKNRRTGSVYIYNLNTITNTIEFIQRINGDNAGYWFGKSLCVSGDGSALVVGSDHNNIKVYHHKDNAVDDNDNSWVQYGNTIQPKPFEIEVICYSVSMSNDGNIVALHTATPDQSFGSYVKIYQYEKSSDKWIDYGRNNNAVFVEDREGDRFGHAISLSSNGNIVAIGAPDNYGIKKDKWACGTVKVFQLNSNTNKWEQLGSNIDGENKGDFSSEYQGVKLSDNGMIVAIGSLYNSDNGYESGSVRIFEYDSNNNQWIQISQDIDGEESRDWSGYSISLSGNGSIVAIGAYKNDGNGDKSGQVRVYRRGGDDDD